MTISLALALFAAASSNSAAPAEAAPADAPAVTQAKPKKPTKICKAVTVTGSRLGKRECKTKEQWEMGESAMELGQKGAKGSLAPPQMQTGI
jgi:hypothetical protein